MNSRIQELANKSGCYECYGVPSDWDDGDYIVTPKQMEKFAELIAKKTEEEVSERFAKVCDQIAKDHRENPRDDIGYATYSEGAAETAEEIAIYLREGE